MPTSPAEKAMASKAHVCIAEILRARSGKGKTDFAETSGMTPLGYSLAVTGKKEMRISTLVKICAHQHFSVDEALLLVRTLVDLAKENKNPIPTSNLEYTMEMTREFARSNIEADPRVIYTFFDACSSIQRGDAQLGR